MTIWKLKCKNAIISAKNSKFVAFICLKLQIAPRVTEVGRFSDFSFSEICDCPVILTLKNPRIKVLYPYYVAVLHFEVRGFVVQLFVGWEALL